MQANLQTQLQTALHGKKHIIWDWNGTLLADVDHAVTIVNSLLTDHGLPLITVQQYKDVFQFPVQNYYLALGFDFSKESFESLCHKFVERFMVGVTNLPLIPEMKSVVNTLHLNGLTQSVLSASDQVSLDSMMVHFELQKYFSYVYGIDNKFAGSKIYRGHELIKNSEIALEHTVMIGDTLHDLEVAQALGIQAVLISHGHQCVKRLRAQHDLVIEVPTYSLSTYQTN